MPASAVDERLATRLAGTEGHYTIFIVILNDSSYMRTPSAARLCRPTVFA
jgi:hypothetical protein